MTTVDPRADLSALHGPDGSGPTFVLGQYVSLMKPRIIELLLTTTIPVMFLAEQGVPDLWLVVATVVGGTLSAGAANTLNCFIDRDIDAVMHRTSSRPLVTGTVSARGEPSSSGWPSPSGRPLWLGLLVNWLSAWLALGALLFYVFGYTLLLKRRTAQNIVWGGAAGCMPVLIGWSAVTDSLSWSAFILFMVTSSGRRRTTGRCRCATRTTTPPRTCRCSRSSSASSSWHGRSSSTRGPWSSRPCPRAGAAVGWVYTVAAVVSGGLFLTEAHRLLSRARAGVGDEGVLRPMRLFHFSITYLTILFVGVALDPIWHLALPGLSLTGTTPDERHARPSGAVSTWSGAVRSWDERRRGGARLSAGSIRLVVGGDLCRPACTPGADPVHATRRISPLQQARISGLERRSGRRRAADVDRRRAVASPHPSQGGEPVRRRGAGPTVTSRASSSRISRTTHVAGRLAGVDDATGQVPVALVDGLARGARCPRSVADDALADGPLRRQCRVEHSGEALAGAGSGVVATDDRGPPCRAPRRRAVVLPRSSPSRLRPARRAVRSGGPVVPGRPAPRPGAARAASKPQSTSRRTRARGDARGRGTSAKVSPRQRLRRS